MAAFNSNEGEGCYDIEAYTGDDKTEKDTVFFPIPGGMKMGAAVSDMLDLLDNGFQQGDPIVFYTCECSNYQPPTDRLIRLTQQWNQEVNYVGCWRDADAYTQLKLQRTESDGYTLWIETIVDGNEVEENPTLYISTCEIEEALTIFYSTGRVYDAYSKTIYGN
jgi:hypothetical protein